MHHTGPAAISSNTLASLRQSFPGGFALVMATGIVSLAMQAQGLRAVAHALFLVNLVAYALLWLAGIARLAHSPRAVAHALGDHVTGPAFLTIVAGTCVLGAQCVALAGSVGEIGCARALRKIRLGAGKVISRERTGIRT